MNNEGEIVAEGDLWPSPGLCLPFSVASELILPKNN